MPKGKATFIMYCLEALILATLSSIVIVLSLVFVYPICQKRLYLPNCCKFLISFIGYLGFYYYLCGRVSAIRHAPSNPPGLDRSKGVRL